MGISLLDMLPKLMNGTAGCRWDNRMPFQAWVAWSRCMYFQACRQEWPDSHGGLESLGAVHPSQRFRDLSTSRSMP